MNEQDWLHLYKVLDNEFKAGVIRKLPTEALESHLLTLCNVKNRDEREQERDRQRAETIRHLIQIRLMKNLYDRNWRMSVFAVILSIIAIAITILPWLTR